MTMSSIIGPPAALWGCKYNQVGRDCYCAFGYGGIGLCHSPDPATHAGEQIGIDYAEPDH
jgi:hypothetical protein